MSIGINRGAAVFKQGENTTKALAAATRAETAEDGADAAKVAAEAARDVVLGVAPSANTLALRAALRANGFFPQPSYRLAANDTPTITVPSGGAVSVINGAAASSANVPVTNTSKITWIGGAAETDVNVTYASRGIWTAQPGSPIYTSFEFNHTGTALEVQLFCTQFAGGTYNFRVLVNDKIAGTALINGDGSNRLVHLSFPVSGTRRIRIELAGGRCRGVNVAATSEITSAGRTYPLVSVIGDSFPEGSGAASLIDGEGVMPFRMAGLNPAMAPKGGTGILNPGGSVNWQNANRLVDLTLNGFTDKITSAAPNLAMGVVFLSINDNALDSTLWGGAASFEEAYKKAVYVIIDHWLTHRDGKPLVIYGPTSVEADPQLDAYRMTAMAEEAVMSLGGPARNLWFRRRMVPNTNTRVGARAKVALTGTLTSGSKVITSMSSTTGLKAGDEVTGTGIPANSRVISVNSGLSQITIDQNATANGAQSLTFATTQSAMMTISDNTHPDPQGHSWDAHWIYDDLRKLILTELN